MKAISKILACIRKADNMYNLFNHGDKVVIGLSGGKDSVALTYCLNIYKKFSHTDFELQPVILDLGFDNFNPEPLIKYCESLGLNLLVSDNKDVYKILKIQQKDAKHLPCSICSRMKKAAINKVANEVGYNKVAFAHHADDAIETLFMNEIYGGRIATFSPKMHLENADIDFIRPFIHVREKDIIQLIKEENLPVFPSACPADKHTNREEIKIFLDKIYKNFPAAKNNFLTMLYNYERYDIWGDEIYYHINQNGLCLKPVITNIDYASFINIRKEVFINEQNVSLNDEFVLEEEKESINFLITLEEKPIGTIRYRIIDGKYKIERFCLLKEYRNKYYGKDAFLFIEEYIFSRFNPCIIYFNAQIQTVDFYKKLGYQEVGKPFIEANIEHIKMFKELK